MKTKIIYSILILLSFSCERIVTDKHCDNFTDDRKQYDTICACIKANNMTFPTENVASGEIYRNSSKDQGEFKKGESYQIDKAFIDAFKKLTGDTSNFRWGELGTIYTDYEIKFRDKDGNVINSAEVSLDGMISTNPNLTTTKWGLLSEKGDSIMRSIVLTYTKK